MEILLQNYKLILGVFMIVAVVMFGAYKFTTQPSAMQKEQINKVLLSLVIFAEKEFSSGTGKLKLSYVYSELVVKFPYLRYVPFSVVESLIEESLEEMRHLLETNPKVAEIVNSEGDK